MTYSEKLKDPRWQKKRLEILERDNFTCQYCKDDKTELHVHHEKYTGEPWDAPNSDLVTLCKHCHKNDYLLDHHPSPLKVVKTVIEECDWIEYIIYLSDGVWEYNPICDSGYFISVNRMKLSLKEITRLNRKK